jgi:hypothetical protein
MKFLSKINTISGLHVAPQGNGLFKGEIFTFVKPLCINPNGKQAIL